MMFEFHVYCMAISNMIKNRKGAAPGFRGSPARAHLLVATWCRCTPGVRWARSTPCRASGSRGPPWVRRSASPRSRPTPRRGPLRDPGPARGARRRCMRRCLRGNRASRTSIASHSERSLKFSTAPKSAAGAGAGPSPGSGTVTGSSQVWWPLVCPRSSSSSRHPPALLSSSQRL